MIYFLLLSLWQDTFFSACVHRSVGQSGWHDTNYSFGVKHINYKQMSSSYTEAVRFLFLFLVFFIFVVKNTLRFCFPSHFSPIILFASEKKGLRIMQLRSIRLQIMPCSEGDRCRDSDNSVVLRIKYFWGNPRRRLYREITRTHPKKKP